MRILTYAAPGLRVVVSHGGAVRRQDSPGSVQAAPLVSSFVGRARGVQESHDPVRVPSENLRHGQAG